MSFLHQAAGLYQELWRVAQTSSTKRWYPGTTERSQQRHLNRMPQGHLHGKLIQAFQSNTQDMLEGSYLSAGLGKPWGLSSWWRKWPARGVSRLPLLRLVAPWSRQASKDGWTKCTKPIKRKEKISMVEEKKNQFHEMNQNKQFWKKQDTWLAKFSFSIIMISCFSLLWKMLWIEASIKWLNVNV